MSVLFCQMKKVTLHEMIDLYEWRVFNHDLF